MAKKTILSHFYNEEWLLPFWLKHHREIFDHGIMINYASTDRSCDIIRELCPTWQIVESRNGQFEPSGIDREVEDYERPLEGWRVALNIPEFLVGNYSYLDDNPEARQIFVGQMMIVDMERREEPYKLDHEYPLWYQRWHGYGIVTDFNPGASVPNFGSAPRAPRSIHNHAISYPVSGRHWTNNQQTYPDLCIFYYGFASMEEASIKRRMQIQNKCPGNGAGSVHGFTLDQLMDRFRKEQQPQSRNIRQDMKPYITAHEEYLGKKKYGGAGASQDHIRNAIEALNNALKA